MQIIIYIFCKHKQLTHPRSIDEENLKAYDCQSRFCFGKNPFVTLDKIYESIDLREVGLIPAARDQQNCGSCWAYGTLGAIENAILLDNQLYSDYWKEQNATNLDLSEQFMLSNTRGLQSYCQGGDFTATINWFVLNKYESFELESNYPYDFKGHQKEFDEKIDLPFKIGRSDYIVPFITVNDTTGSSQDQVGVFSIQPLKETGKRFDEAAIRSLKSLLSRGIAVVGSLSLSMSSKSAAAFMGYAGTSVLDFPCQYEYAPQDHQIVFVGYGKYAGTPVWVVRNSYGKQWGSEGHFYIPIGGNSFCAEMNGYAVLPKPLVDYVNSTESFQRMNQVPYGNYIRGNHKFLDVVENSGLIDNIVDEYKPQVNPPTGMEVLLITGSACVVVLIIAVIVVYSLLKCRKTRTVYDIDYVVDELLADQFPEHW